MAHKAINYYQYIMWLLIIKIAAMQSVFSARLPHTLPIVLDSFSKIRVWEQQMAYLRDCDCKWQLSDLLDTTQALNYSYTENFDDPNACYWLVMRIHNRTVKPYAIEFNYTLEEAVLFQKNFQNKWVSDTSGILSYTLKSHAFGEDFLFIPPNNEPQLFIVKTKQLIKQGIYINFFTTDYLINVNSSKRAFSGFVLGVIFISAFYSLLLFIRLRTDFYLYLSLFLSTFGIFQWVERGYFFRYLYLLVYDFDPSSVLIYAYHLPTVTITVSVLLMVKSVLREHNYLVLSRIIPYLIVLRILLLPLTTYFPVLLSTETDLIFLSLPMLACIYLVFKKDYDTYLFVIGYFFIFLAAYVKAIALNYNSRNFFGINFKEYYLWGNITAAVFLFLTIAQKIKKIQNQLNIAQAIRLQDLMEKQQLKDRVNRDLENMVNERTREISLKSKQLDMLIYKTSHDIRGPLKSIIGIAQIALTEDMPLKIKEFFTHIQRSAQRLDGTVNDLLSFIKSDQKLSSKTLIDFDVIIQEVTDNLGFLQGFQQMHLQVDKPEQMPHFYGDNKLMYSIFQNLIENAVNYRDTRKAQTTLQIQFSVANQLLIITFADNGIGIAEEHLPYIFDKFYQANPHSKGTGLGLYLIKMATESMGGVVLVESIKTQGTTFILKFPLSTTA